MNDTRFTPGPWRFVEYDGNFGAETISSKPVADVYDSECAKQDAWLIAAAPEMYAVLKAVAYEADRETGRDVLVSKIRFQKVLDVLAKVEAINAA